MKNVLNKEKVINDLLFENHYFLMQDGEYDVNKEAYYAAYLFSHFGIMVTNPSLLREKNIKIAAEQIGEVVPSSFYQNPQDVKYFTVDELLLEQLVSYLFYGSSIKRVELFKKELPTYPLDDRLKYRDFTILSYAEADKVIDDYISSLCSYKRPFSTIERERFLALTEYYHGENILCKDNIIDIIFQTKRYYYLAEKLDKKDLVKASIKLFGRQMHDYYLVDGYEVLLKLIPLVKDCPLSKKQAKYFNKLCKLAGLSPIATNHNSPYRLANELIKQDDIIGAAKVFKNNGALFIRQFRFLLSIAKENEVDPLLDLLDDENPVVLFQLLMALKNQEAPRIFIYFAYNRLINYREDDLSFKYQRIIADETLAKANEKVMSLFYNHYRKLPSIGKIYLDDAFKKVAVPINTSASGSGLDVLPTGSRVKINGDYLRTFVTWEGIHDIDSSLGVVNNDGKIECIGFWNYNALLLGESVLSSGDVTSDAGTEYYDIKISELRELGYKLVIQFISGYHEPLSRGEIYCGYQNKDNLNTQAWDPKNIELKIKVAGDTRGYIAFGIDLETKEIVFLNQLMKCESNVINPKMVNAVSRYMNKDYLKINMYDTLKSMGEVTNDVNEANIIFSDTQIPLKEQTVIHSFSRDKLIKLINR